MSYDLSDQCKHRLFVKDHFEIRAELAPEVIMRKLLVAGRLQHQTIVGEAAAYVQNDGEEDSERASTIMTCGERALQEEESAPECMSTARRRRRCSACCRRFSRLWRRSYLRHCCRRRTCGCAELR